MAKGGASHPVHVISASDLKQNGGNFRLRSGPAVKVIGNTDTENVAQGKLQSIYVVPDGFPVQGGEPLSVTNAIDVADRGLRGGLIATPVYVVNGDEWPAPSGNVLLESGDYLLLESGDQLLLG